MKIQYRKLVFFGIRFIVYAGIMVLLNLIFQYDATHSADEVKITENSLTELFQEIFVFVVAAGFFIVSRRSRELAPVTYLFALFFLISFIREFNNQIEFWFYLASPFIVWFFFLLIKNFRKVLTAFERFIELRPSGAFFIGFLVCYLFSRLFGQTSFWKVLLEEAYSRAAKNMAEEGIELLGYAIILISVVELLALVYRENSAKRGI